MRKHLGAAAAVTALLAVTAGSGLASAQPAATQQPESFFAQIVDAAGNAVLPAPSLPTIDVPDHAPAPAPTATPTPEPLAAPAAPAPKPEPAPAPEPVAPAPVIAAAASPTAAAEEEPVTVGTVTVYVSSPEGAAAYVELRDRVSAEVIGVYPVDETGTVTIIPPSAGEWSIVANWQYPPVEDGDVAMGGGASAAQAVVTVGSDPVTVDCDFSAGCAAR